MNVTEFSCAVHIGTHVDAPCHFIRDGKTIGELDLDRWIGDAVLLHLPKGRFQTVDVADLQSHASEIGPGDMLLIRTGWGANWGNHGYYEYEHPYLTEEGAAWLLDRGVRALGMDVTTPDLPIESRKSDFTWPVHKLLLAEECLIMENLHLANAPAGRLELIACPINLRDSDGAPARIVARGRH